VVPIALLGTFAVLLALGFSINVLTMFGMVLVMGHRRGRCDRGGQNVERIMSEEGLSPVEATRQGDEAISRAIIGVTLVLIAVFRAARLLRWLDRNIYRQFSATIGHFHRRSRPFWRCRSLRRCAATLLKPVEAGHHHERRASSAGSIAASLARPKL